VTTAELAEAVPEPDVAVARAFVRKRRRRRWYDWYTIGFALAIGLGYLADFLATPISRLAARFPAAHAAATGDQAIAGGVLVIVAAAGLVALAQLLGPLTLPPPDASWLLLTPLDRRTLLRRPVAWLVTLAGLAGGVLGVLALAMASPYLHHGTHGLPVAWMSLAAVSGAGFLVAAALAALLTQPHARWRARLRTACATVAVLAVITTVANERWGAVSRAVARGLAGGVSERMLMVLAAAGMATASAAAAAAWRLLPRFPASVIWDDSVRAGRVMLAAQFMNAQLLSWIAEDGRWRGRVIPFRRWPLLPPAMALAWADWRRLARQRGTLAMLAATSLAPALVGAALTGHERSLAVAAVLAAGAVAAGTRGTAGVRRETSDPVLRRLFGVSQGAALAARAALPGVLAAAWLSLALVLLSVAGVLSGWLWPLLGPVAGPGLAAVALRMARTPPIDPAERGPDTPLGSVSGGMLSWVLTVVIAIFAVNPTMRAVITGHLGVRSAVAQVACSAITLGAYLAIAGRGPR
jgi:hypothetical protein